LNTTSYLNRINISHIANADYATLVSLHERHVFNIPFENLDIHYKKIFDLDPEKIYDKVITRRRGGFCYELNFLFSRLLTALGFDAQIIESRIFTEQGKAGPAFDHMSIHVKTDREYLADVGFGDLFVRPLEIREGVQHDGRHYFKIDPMEDDCFLLSMSSDGIDFHKKYTFSLKPVTITDFHALCFDKQINPESYFVKNTICTKPTTSGRITLFNSKLVERRNEERIVTDIPDNETMQLLLSEKFKILPSSL
jgi:N-hydroxyarylamine O-acetyltransferase